MAIVLFNGNALPQDPSGIKEGTVRKVHNSITVAGVSHRYWYADKYQVTLNWKAIPTSTYNVLFGYLYNGANAIVYTNTITGITFSGFPTSDVDVFYQGASFLRDFTTTILQL